MNRASFFKSFITLLAAPKVLGEVDLRSYKEKRDWRYQTSRKIATVYYEKGNAYLLGENGLSEYKYGDIERIKTVDGVLTHVIDKKDGKTKLHIYRTNG